MFEYKVLNDKYLNQMCDLWNEVMGEEKVFKPFTYDEYKEKLLTNSDFSFDLVFGVFDKETLIAFCIGISRKQYEANPKVGAYINTIVVKKEYRKQGIGSTLLNMLEKEFKENGKESINANFFLPSCYEWYIPNTEKHNHPCAPGIRVNSNEYFFFLHRGYEVLAFEDAFHLDLCDYEISKDIQAVLDKNASDGITIELYDKEKHFGLEEFYKELNIYDFEKVIRANLALENPHPFLVVSNKGKVVGWTGAMWNEESGRAHFDGIAILDSVRGRGLGKALFSLLAYYSKNNGAKFMTFYTGLTNHARYIYMKAGFKIAQTFAIMKKKI